MILPPCLLLLGVKLVAESPHCFDVMKSISTACGLQLLTERANMHINSATITEKRVSPDLFQQSLACKHPPRRCTKHHEHIELLSCQCHQMPFDFYAHLR